MDKTDRVNLGLALLSLVAIPGVPLTYDDIAAWCDCKRQAIENINRLTLKKIRNQLMFRDRALWDELREEFYDRRSPARSPRRSALATRDLSLLS